MKNGFQFSNTFAAIFILFFCLVFNLNTTSAQWFESRVIAGNFRPAGTERPVYKTEDLKVIRPVHHKGQSQHTGKVATEVAVKNTPPTNSSDVQLPVNLVQEMLKELGDDTFSNAGLGVVTFDLTMVDQPACEAEKTLNTFFEQKTPSFPGGEVAMRKFIARKFEYPALAREEKVQGVVVISFLVGTDGAISDFRIEQDPGKGCGAEGIRLVKSMPNWLPAEVEGVPVEARHILRVQFMLQ
jgi:protein TonB